MAVAGRGGGEWALISYMRQKHMLTINKNMNKLQWKQVMSLLSASVVKRPSEISWKERMVGRLLFNGDAANTQAGFAS